MPTFRAVQRVPYPRETVFAVFACPANVVAMAPPALGLELVEGPPAVAIGTRTVVRARRWGVLTRVVTEVVQVEPPAGYVEVQVQGPFRHWWQERFFRALGDDATELIETIRYEPPGGLLGLVLTGRAIEEQLRYAYEHRVPRLLEMLAAVRR